MKGINFLLIGIIILVFISCKKEYDNEVPSNTLTGKISYDGDFRGTIRNIYIRAYTSDSLANGTPDFTMSIKDTGDFKMYLGNYTGPLYVSAFMDIDNSGRETGPTANGFWIEGLYADPSGFYRDSTSYYFPSKYIVREGNNNISILLEDNGVVKAKFQQQGSIRFGLTLDYFNSNMWFFTDCELTPYVDSCYLAVPAHEYIYWYPTVSTGFFSTTQGPRIQVRKKNRIVNVNFD